MLAELCATLRHPAGALSRPITCSMAPRPALTARPTRCPARRLWPHQGCGRRGDPRRRAASMSSCGPPGFTARFGHNLLKTMLRLARERRRAALRRRPARLPDLDRRCRRGDPAHRAAACSAASPSGAPITSPARARRPGTVSPAASSQRRARSPGAIRASSPITTRRVPDPGAPARQFRARLRSVRRDLRLPRRPWEERVDAPCRHSSRSR